MVDYIDKPNEEDRRIAELAKLGPMKAENNEGFFLGGQPVAEHDTMKKYKKLLLGEEPGYPREVFSADDEIWGDR